MVGRGKAKLLIAVVLFTAASFNSFADYLLTTDLTVRMVTYKTSDDSFDVSSIATGEIGITATGNRKVKAGLELGINSALPVPLLIDRLYIKTRFPSTILTIGKSRLSWGQGFAFNAGDLLYGSTDIGFDLTSSELRTQSSWMLGAKYSFERFTYLEAAVLPPVNDPLEALAAAAYPAAYPDYAPITQDIENTKAGARFVTKLFGMDVETAYLYDGPRDVHKTALNLFLPWEVDLYASAQLELPSGMESWSDVENSLGISGGIFANLPAPDGQTLSMRIEALAKPYSQWEEAASASNYGLFLYPELAWAPDATLQVQMRSIISPIDQSGVLIGNLSWNVYQGFSIITSVSGQIGEADDVFGYEKDGGLAFILGANFIY